MFVVFASNWIAVGLVGCWCLVWLLFWLIGLVAIVRGSCALGLMFWVVCASRLVLLIVLDTCACC